MHICVTQLHCDFVGRVWDLNSLFSSSFLTQTPGIVLMVRTCYRAVPTAVCGGGKLVLALDGSRWHQAQLLSALKTQ